MNEEAAGGPEEGQFVREVMRFFDSRREGNELKVENYPQSLLITPHLNYMQDELWTQTEAEAACHLNIVNQGDWLGNPANFKRLGYCSILSRSRDIDPAHRNPKWRRSFSRGLMNRLLFGFHAIKL